MFIIFLIPVILMFICARKESFVTSVYQHFNVYTRFTAYITISLMLAGIFFALGCILSVLIFEYDSLFKSILTILWGIGLGLVLFSIGRRLYKGIAASCPAPLKKKLFKSMLITAFGVGCKIVVFYLIFVWKLAVPKNMVGPNGENLLVFNGEVYNPDGTHVGSLTGTDSFKPNKNYTR